MQQGQDLPIIPYLEEVVVGAVEGVILVAKAEVDVNQRVANSHHPYGNSKSGFCTNI